jgi:hypothetical protein
MKALTYILTGIIASTTGFTDLKANTAPSVRRPDHQSAAGAPQTISGPYSRVYISDADFVFSGSSTNRIRFGTERRADDSAVLNGYPEIILPRFDIDASPAAGRSEPRRPKQAAAELLFAGLSEDEVIFIRYGGTLPKARPQRRGNERGKAVQVITIEPLNLVRRLPPDTDILRQQALIPRKPEPAGLSWLSPRTVLNTWAARWMNEPNEMPVVIVKHEF